MNRKLIFCIQNIEYRIIQPNSPFPNLFIYYYSTLLYPIYLNIGIEKKHAKSPVQIAGKLGETSDPAQRATEAFTLNTDEVESEASGA